jgi:alanyl-tRNA synthetase
VLGTIHGGKPTFVAMVSGDLVVKGFHAGEIVKQVAKVAGGGGGGKAGLGQGSGRDKAKMDEALDQAEQIIRAHYDKDSGTWKGSG